MTFCLDMSWKLLYYPNISMQYPSDFSLLIQTKKRATHKCE